MSLSSTRGLVRVSKNPACTVQAAMALAQVPEKEFYRCVEGQDYPGEYGEREAARRRGAKFEANLHQNNSALLRKALATLFELDPEAMVVRNFADEIPGPPQTMRAARLKRMRLLLTDLAAGREVPHLLVQPQLALAPAGGGSPFFVAPDFLAFDPKSGTYVPGEEKSFITRQNVAEPGDRDLSRRQAAVQILALRAELARAKVKGRADVRAAFVFATPFGLAPAPAFLEDLHAEVHEVTKALAALEEARSRVTAIAGRDPARMSALELSQVFDSVPSHYQEGCLGSCVMASVCERRAAGTAKVLGDDAGDLLGREKQLVRVVDLLRGSTRPRGDERELVRQLQKASRALGLEEGELARRLA